MNIIRTQSRVWFKLGSAVEPGRVRRLTSSGGQFDWPTDEDCCGATAAGGQATAWRGYSLEGHSFELLRLLDGDTARASTARRLRRPYFCLEPAAGPARPTRTG